LIEINLTHSSEKCIEYIINNQEIYRLKKSFKVMDQSLRLTKLTAHEKPELRLTIMS